MFGCTGKDACNVTCWTVPLVTPVCHCQCNRKVEQDDQQTEMTMVPATLKHLVTITANLTERKRLEEEQSSTQGKRIGLAGQQI